MGQTLEIFIDLFSHDDLKFVSSSQVIFSTADTIFVRYLIENPSTNGIDPGKLPISSGSIPSFKLVDVCCISHGPFVAAMALMG